MGQEASWQRSKSLTALGDTSVNAKMPNHWTNLCHIDVRQVALTCCEYMGEQLEAGCDNQWESLDRRGQMGPTL